MREEPFSLHGGGPQSNFGFYFGNLRGRGSEVMLFSSVTKMQFVFEGIFSGEIFNKVQRGFLLLLLLNVIKNIKRNFSYFLRASRNVRLSFYVR